MRLIYKALVAFCVFLIPVQSKDAKQDSCLEWLHRSGSLAVYEAMILSVQSERTLTPDCRKAANAEIDQAIDRLVEAGRLTSPYPYMEYMLVAQHRWFTTGPEGSGGSNRSGNQEGLYVFYQPLFDLSMRSWFTQFKIEKGSQIAHLPNVKLDSTVVGYKVEIAGFDGGLRTHAVKVIGMIDEHTIILSEAAKEDIKRYVGRLIPTDYDDSLCNCIMPKK